MDDNGALAARALHELAGLLRTEAGPDGLAREVRARECDTLEAAFREGRAQITFTEPPGTASAAGYPGNAYPGRHRVQGTEVPS